MQFNKIYQKKINKSDASKNNISFKYYNTTGTVTSNGKTIIDEFNNNEYIVQGYAIETDNTYISIDFGYYKQNPHKIQINIINKILSNQKFHAKYVILYIII